MTQASSARGAATREAVASSLATAAEDKPVELVADEPPGVADEPSRVILMSRRSRSRRLRWWPRSQPWPRTGSTPHINGVAKKPGMLAAQAMAEAEAAVEKTEREASAPATAKFEAAKTEAAKTEAAKTEAAKTEVARRREG